MKRKASQTLLYIALFCLGHQAYGQAPVRPAERDIQVQKLFIEASKEKVLGNLDDAEYLFNEVVKKDKANGAAYYELARIYITDDAIDKANRSIQSALNIEPDNIWYNTLQADLFVAQERYKEATQVFEHLADIAPEEVGFKYELATLYAKTGKLDQAIKIYNEVESKMGVTAEISAQKHLLYLSMNKTAKAEQELERLVKAFPLDTDYLLLLAEHHKKTGDAEKAKEIYQKILTIDPKDPEANLAMAEEFQASGQEAKYLNALQGIFANPDIPIDSKIQEIIPYIGKVAENKDDDLAAEAISLTELLTTTHSDDAKAFAVHGDLLNHANRPEEALAQYHKAVKLNNSVFSVWEQMLFIQSNLGKTDELLKTSEEAIDLFPNQPIAFFFNGIAYSQKNQQEEAIDALQQALMMSGRNEQMKEQIYVQLGSAYYHTSNFKKSDEYFDKALAINENDALALNNYSYYLAERGTNLEKAETMAAKANKLSPNTPSFLDTHGWVLYKRKKYKEAKTLIGKALEAGGQDSPAILENYGDVLFQLHEVEEAVKYWQKAQDKGASSDQLTKKIENRKMVE